MSTGSGEDDELAALLREQEADAGVAGNPGGEGESYQQSSTSGPNSSPIKAPNADNQSDHITEHIRFYSLVRLFERVAAARGSTKKNDALHKWWEKYKDKDILPVMRLLIPQWDRGRNTYGLKELSIAKTYVNILNLGPNSQDAKRLLNWRNPNAQRRSSTAVGEFTDIVYEVLKSRCRTEPTQSIAAINRQLDALNTAETTEERKKIMAWLLHNTTAQEQKWILRIILKDLKIGAREETVLKNYHPNGPELYHAHMDLKEVCKLLGAVEGDRISSGIRLFCPIKPMLAKYKTIEDACKLDLDVYTWETKLDGERIHIHKGGRDIKLFSRNAKDYTNLYGPKLFDVIMQNIESDKCILDGELLVYDTELERFEEFGGIKTIATSDLNDDVKHLCLMIFDVLMIEGKETTGLPLSDRRDLLKTIVTPKPTWIDVVASHPIREQKEVAEALDRAVENRDEGLILKRIDTPYVPNERKLSWLKIKPEYEEGIREDLDLVIIGGYYGSGSRRSGGISHFLLGVGDRADNNQEPTNFYAFCKVGTGYSLAELGVLRDHLNPHWHEWNQKAIPDWFMGWVPAPGERPDVWILPSKSKVVQVKAAEISPTTKFRAQYTLRFPRVVRIRYDKDWTDGADFNAMLELVNRSNGRLTLKRSAEGGEGGEDDVGRSVGKKKKPRLQRRTGVMERFLGTDLKDVTVVSDIFSNFEFYVVNDSETFPKASIEKCIASLSGKIVQNPTDSTTHVIACAASVRVNNLKRHRDIIHPQWIEDCAASTPPSALNLHPRYMLHTTDATKLSFAENFDSYGDSFRESITKDHLTQVLSKMPKAAATYQLSQMLAEHVPEGRDEREFCTKWQMFRNCCAYFYQESQLLVTKDYQATLVSERYKMAALTFRYYGGRVSKFMVSGVTHVVVDTDDVELESLEDLEDSLQGITPSPPIVNLDWLYTSVEAGVVANTNNFLVSKK